MLIGRLELCARCEITARVHHAAQKKVVGSRNPLRLQPKLRQAAKMGSGALPAPCKI